MTKAELLVQLEEMMQMRPGSLKGNENLTDLSQWDSLQLLNFLVLVDEKFDVEINHDDVVEAESVNDLVALVAPQLDG